jgi:hypothetical protein
MKMSMPSNAARNTRVFRMISLGLVFLLMVCAAMTVGILLQNIVPGWHAGLIAGIMLFVVLERFYTYRQLKSLTPLSSEWAISLGAQWIVMVLFIRLLLSYANGFGAFVADLSRFVRGSLRDFFSAEFVIAVLLALLIWVVSARFLELLDEIGLDQEIASREETVPIQTELVPAHQRLMSLVFGLGIGLVILTALTRMDVHLDQAGGLPNVSVSGFSGAEAGALWYFMFGLGLLSLSRLMSLHTHWNRMRIPVSSRNLVRQWGVYSLAFLVLLVVIVSLLPAGDSLGFFPVLGTLFEYLVRIFAFLSALIVLLILLLFSLPFLLLGKPPSFLSGAAPPPFPVFPTQVQPPMTSSALLELIRSILLWGALVVLIVYAVVRFVSGHETILTTLRRSRVVNWLILAWQWLYSNVQKSGTSLSNVVSAGWQTLVKRFEGRRILLPMDFLNPRSLDPRRRIYFFYLAMIRRSAEQGVPRIPSQTPAEYAATLEKALPEANEEVGSITEAFIRARYSREDIDARQADAVKATWNRICAALKKSKNE